MDAALPIEVRHAEERLRRAQEDLIHAIATAGMETIMRLGVLERVRKAREALEAAKSRWKRT